MTFFSSPLFSEIWFHFECRPTNRVCCMSHTDRVTSYMSLSESVCVCVRMGRCASDMNRSVYLSPWSELWHQTAWIVPQKHHSGSVSLYLFFPLNSFYTFVIWWENFTCNGKKLKYLYMYVYIDIIYYFNQKIISCVFAQQFSLHVCFVPAVHVL